MEHLFTDSESVQRALSITQISSIGYSIFLHTKEAGHEVTGGKVNQNGKLWPGHEVVVSIRHTQSSKSGEPQATTKPQ